MRRVQLLAVGACAQKLPQPRRLRAGRAEGVLHLRRREVQQTPHGGGGGQRAGRGRGVEHLVVAAAQEFAHANADLVAGHAGRHQLGTAGANALRHRQRRRKDHGRRVEHRAVVHVVLLGHMGRGGIGQRRHHGRAAGAVAYDFTRPLCGPLRQRKARDAGDGARLAAGEHRAEPVHPQVFGAALHGLRHVAPLQGGGELGQGVDGGLGFLLHFGLQDRRVKRR